MNYMNQTIAANVAHALISGNMLSKPKYNYVAMNESVKSNDLTLILDDRLELIDETEFHSRNSQMMDGDSCQHDIITYVDGRTTLADICKYVGTHEEGMKYARDIAKQYFGMV
ncbi:hypothetical protein VPHD518_0090 [Vibrio phage D518]